MQLGRRPSYKSYNLSVQKPQTGYFPRCPGIHQNTQGSVTQRRTGPGKLATSNEARTLHFLHKHPKQ